MIVKGILLTGYNNYKKHAITGNCFSLCVHKYTQ